MWTLGIAAAVRHKSLCGMSANEQRDCWLKTSGFEHRWAEYLGFNPGFWTLGWGQGAGVTDLRNDDGWGLDIAHPSGSKGL